MEIHRPNPGTVRIADLDSVLCDLLRKIVPGADPAGSEAAQARLFSKPTTESGEADFVADWQEYIVPELRQLFQSSLQLIERDLASLREGRGATLDIPVTHLEGWIHGLNQARLALTARHAIAEEEMERLVPLTGGERSFAMLQVRFYGILEELFLHELEDD